MRYLIVAKDIVTIIQKLVVGHSKCKKKVFSLER